ncbi:MAG: hypothetical protein ACREL3_00700 [Gemmatimonadales bacterium]
MQDVIQRPDFAYLIVLVGAISLRAMALRRRAVLALSALAFGFAALPAGPHPVTAGFILLGVLGAGAVGVQAGSRGLPLILGVILAAWTSRGLLAGTGTLPSVLGAMALAAIAGVMLWLARLARSRLTLLPSPFRRSVPGRLAVLLILSLLLTALGSHLLLVFLGAAGASWAGWLIAQSWGGIRWPVVPVLVTIGLLATYLFMATIAGPDGLSMGGLPSLPVSPAAETLLAAGLLSSSWLLTGLWPIHRCTVASLTAPAAAFLLVRVGLVVSPAGMEHWRALAAPLVMLGLWHAAATRWGAGLAVGGAWLALVSLDPSGVVAAGWLLPVALALDVLGPEHDGELVLRRVGRGVALLAGGWGGLLALEAGLHGEVVYTVLAAASVALGISAGGQAMTPSEPKNTAPSA